MSTPLLEANALVCGYGDHVVLHGVSLALHAGDFLGIIGPNGCGKSTLLAALTGWLPLQSGAVLLDDHPLGTYAKSDVARQVAVVPQASVPAFAFTVRETVEMGRYPHLGRFAVPAAIDRAMVDEALALTDVAHLQDRPVDHLSGGEYQRVTIARALAQQPRVLLLDEPTAHLDLGHQQAIFELLARLQTERAMAVLCVSHDINLAAEYCPRLLLMSEGRVVIDGTPDAVVTEEHLGRVYGTLVRVHANPYSGQPLVVLQKQGCGEVEG